MIDRLKKEEITEKLLGKSISSLRKRGMKEERNMIKQKQEGILIEIVETRKNTEGMIAKVETKEILEDTKETIEKIEEKKEAKEK
jgi:hypothetical protein